MATTISQKLKIKEGYTLLTINAPKDFGSDLGELPADVKISDKTKVYNQLHWFVKDKAQMEKEVSKVVGLLKNDVVCWIYYPKGTSKIQTDLTRDKGWDALLQYDNLHWISLISFNDTWSAFGMRLKTEGDKKKEAVQKSGRFLITSMQQTKPFGCRKIFRACWIKTKKKRSFSTPFHSPIKKNMWNGL